MKWSGEGGVNLRGWGNEPRLLGNWSRLDLSASLPKEEPLPVEQQCHY